MLRGKSGFFCFWRLVGAIASIAFRTAGRRPIALQGNLLLSKRVDTATRLQKRRRLKSIAATDLLFLLARVRRRFSVAEIFARRRSATHDSLHRFRRRHV